MSKQDIVQVPVRILDKEYTISCPIDEREGLQESARLLNEKMRDIRNSGKVIGSERIAVMAALNLTHDLLQQRQHGSGYNGDIGQRLRRMQERIESALDSDDRQLRL